MTVRLFDDDSHLFEFESSVVSCEAVGDGYAVVLEGTAFFPEAGGQGSDRGTLGEARVTDVQITDGVIYHYTDRSLNPGERVHGRIDAERRLDFMQQHSGEHVVSGIAHTLFGCENVGFHLSEDIVTLDFDIPLDREQISVIEKKANEAVRKNVRFLTYYPDEATLKTLSYRSKKELEGAVRIVEIEGVDMCACCAPHVKQSGEIGLIKLLDSERLRGGVRIELKCGLRAREDYDLKNCNCARIGDLLSLKQNETADGVEKLLERVSEQKYAAEQLKKRLCETVIRTGGEQSCLFVDGLDMKELQLIACGLNRNSGLLRAVITPTDSGASFCICGSEAETDALLREMRESLPVRGGGRNGVIQGSIAADIEKIKFFFKNR